MRHLATYYLLTSSCSVKAICGEEKTVLLTR
jgi:hypothetical protein